MNNVITFNKAGYEPFLDFIKAYAIICVLMGHSFPYLAETGYPLWYGMQVPLFVLVQVFHSFKKEKPVRIIAKCSYEIFLIQMAIIPLFPQLTFIGNKYLLFGVRTTCIFAISIIGGYYFNITYNKALQKIKTL